MHQQIGLIRFKLSQSQYKSGAFYLSAVLDGENVQSIDGRFYVEEANKLTPTKRGFRIPRDNLDAFCKALRGDLREIDDFVLFENRSFRFYVRHMNDKYGEGIDFRKYRTTTKFNGWDRSGIRMKLEDVKTMLDWLVDLDIKKVTGTVDVFAGKNFCGHQIRNPKNERDIETPLNPAIEEILEY